MPWHEIDIDNEIVELTYGQIFTVLNALNGVQSYMQMKPGPANKQALPLLAKQQSFLEDVLSAAGKRAEERAAVAKNATSQQADNTERDA